MPAGVLTLRDLSQVTLVAVTDVAIPATARAIALSQAGLRFGDVLFLSPAPPPAGTPATWRAIAPLGSRQGYSRFLLHDLAAHIATDHVLCVQWDGYVLNPAAWDPAFLTHDYIGAPWPHFADGMRVGNGGFSLRSKRLIDACRALPITNEAEDIAICRTHRAMLEDRFGIRFAPEAVAARFAWERARPNGDEFGFHGAFNMVGRDGALADLLGTIEPGLLNRREHRELLRAALLRGDWCLARAVWRRLRDPAARRY